MSLKEGRAGQLWTVEEEAQLVVELATFIIKSAKEHARTETAISVRVRRMLDTSIVSKEIMKRRD